MKFFFGKGFRINWLILASIPFQYLNAQQQGDSIAGDYYLQGVMETASVISIKPDHSFEFFFSYGAVDRSGTGSWEKKDDHIVLNSRIRPPLDFKLADSRKTTDSFITIQITDKNSMLLSYVECMLNPGTDNLHASTGSDGMARFTRSHVDSIGLLFRLCPDRVSTFHPAKDHNYFEFHFEPWIAEVFFDKLSFRISKDRLIGPHPLLDGQSYNYIKGN